MFNNVLSEINLIENIQKEYLKLINYYHNIKRPSVFLRYLNINKENSVYDNLNTVQHKYQHDTKLDVDLINNTNGGDIINSGIIYDIYDYTPAYNTGQNINSSELDNAGKGHQFNTNLNLQIYTIIKPRINDLITFPYPPYQSKINNIFSDSNDDILNNNKQEIFRVTNFSTVVSNVINTIESIYWYDIQLEYAFLYNINKLNINQRYVYDLVNEKNILYENFLKILNYSDKLTKFLEILVKNNFHSKYELYYSYDMDDNIIFPLDHNKILYDFLCTKHKYQDYFFNIKRPFGINNYNLEEIGSNKFIDINNNIIEENVIYESEFDVKKINSENIDIFNVSEIILEFTKLII